MIASRIVRALTEHYGNNIKQSGRTLNSVAIYWKQSVGKFGITIVGQKRCYFEKRTREVIDNKRSPEKTNPNKPKNKAGKLLKTGSCGKNKPKNKPGHIVENKGRLKNKAEIPALNPVPAHDGLLFPLQFHSEGDF